MRGMLDAMYWKLHTAYLRNEREDAKHFLHLLCNECGDSFQKLVEEIGPVQVLRFRRIRKEVEEGTFRRLYGDGVGIEELRMSPPWREKGGSEKEFCRKLLSREGLCRLFLVLSVSEGALVVPEVRMDPYGRCDMVIREGKRVHVVEVKVGEAPTSVVAQIDKYRLCMELEMCLGLHDEVLAYVLAESFSPYVSSELSRIDVRMIEHRCSLDSLRYVVNDLPPDKK